MKTRVLAPEILEKSADAPRYDEAPYVEAIKFALANGGGLEVELEEGDTVTQTKRRLQKAARNVEGAGRLKWIRNKDNGADVLQFVFREPRAPRAPRAPKVDAQGNPIPTKTRAERAAERKARKAAEQAELTPVE